MELGYALGRKFRGKGYMPEAVGAVIGWALNRENIYRVWAACDVDNATSIRVLEKVRMQREGLLRRWVVHPNIGKEPRDCYVYAIAK